MNNYKNKILIFSLLLFSMLTFGNKDVEAYTDKYSTMINLNKYTDDASFDFTMPKDGKIKLNVNVEDTDSVPGNLKLAIQTGYSKDSTKIKEFTGITSSQGITDSEIELKEGTYYLYYELSNETGDLKDTSLDIYCKVEILPTIPDNISELSTQNITSFEDINLDECDEIKFGDKYMDLILPFTVDEAGGLIITLAEETVNYDSLDSCLYEDKECTKPIGNTFFLNALDRTVNTARSIPKKGTYYIKFTLNSNNPAGETAFKVKLNTISRVSRTLSSGKSTVSYQDVNSKKITYKIVVNNPGLISFYVTPYENTKSGIANFQLLDKNKKKITKSSKVLSYKNSDGNYDPIAKYYTVPKGTYYLQIDTACGVYQLENQFTKGTYQAGTKKSDAKVIKLGGKTVGGYFTVSDKTSKVDWYKFTLSSSQNVKLTIGYKLDGDIVFEILDSKGTVLWNSKNDTECEEGFYYHWAESEYPKGTYYIKVYKGSSSSSFTYALAITN